MSEQQAQAVTEPAWVTDRWLGKTWQCWLCGSEERLTRAVIFVPAATVDDGGGGRRQLWAYVPACARCTQTVLLHGMLASGWQPPALGTLEQVLADNPLDGPCDLCDGGKKPPTQGLCICHSGRRQLHGWEPGAQLVRRIFDGLEMVGPSPAPLWVPARPLAESAYAVAKSGGGGRASAADLAGPWDTEGPGVQPAAPAAPEVPGPEPADTTEARLERRLARRGGGGPAARRPPLRA